MNIKICADISYSITKYKLFENSYKTNLKKCAHQIYWQKLLFKYTISLLIFRLVFIVSYFCVTIKIILKRTQYYHKFLGGCQNDTATKWHDF